MSEVALPQLLDYVACEGHDCPQRAACLRTVLKYEGEAPSYAPYDKLVGPCGYFLPMEPA